LIRSLRSSRLVAGAASACALLAPAVAAACPYCATGANQGIGMSVALGAFILLPFGVAGVVYSVLRREAE
jgi:hypothetical protein